MCRKKENSEQQFQDKLVEIIEEEFGLNRLVKFEEIMQKGYAKEVVQYLYWARERYEFAVNYIDSISVKYLTDEKDFASMLEELQIINQQIQ